MLHYVKSPADQKPELLKSARTADDVWVMLKSAKLRSKVTASILQLREADAAAGLLEEQQCSTRSSVRIEMEDPAQDVWDLDTWQLLDLDVTLSEPSTQLNFFTYTDCSS